LTILFGDHGSWGIYLKPPENEQKNSLPLLRTARRILQKSAGCGTQTTNLIIAFRIAGGKKNNQHIKKDKEYTPVAGVKQKT